MRWWPVLLLLPLAGCLGGSAPETAAAHDAHARADDSASSRYDYSLFIGITGSEGELNLTNYRQALLDAGDNQARMARTFDLETDDGELGDGKVGAWYTTHFAYDADAQLIGGLISQVRPDGRLHTLLAPFRGPYGGAVTLATHGERAAPTAVMDSLTALEAFLAEREEQDETVLCTLRTRTEDWKLDSPEAAAIAMAQPTMKEHMAQHPGGEITYYYFPGLAVAEDCPAELRVEDNYWLILHTDLDRFIDPTTPDPTLSTVRIDAATGEVLDAQVTGLVQLQQPFDATIDHADGVVPPVDWTTLGVPILVGDGATSLSLDASRSERPLYLIEEQVRLVGPDGRVIEGQTLYSSHRFMVADPAAGEWMFEYRYRSATPQGRHVVDLHGDIHYG